MKTRLSVNDLKSAAWNYYKSGNAPELFDEQKELYNWFLLLYSPATLSAMGAEAAAEQANEAVIEYNAKYLGMQDTIQVRRHNGNDRLLRLPEQAARKRLYTRAKKSV